MTEAVQTALDDLYRAFGHVRCPSRIEISPVKNEADYLPLVRVPLRELSADQLWNYTYSVFYTVGGTEDFFYLLPRILELASVPFSPFDNEVVFKKVALSGWPGEWRGDCRLAFESYLQAVVASWQEVEMEMNSWVCALSFCLPDLPSHLDSLLSGNASATSNLIRFYEANSEFLLKQRLGNSFWERSEGPYRAVLQWLQREDVNHHIQNAYLESEFND
jgi:hypothetical protein